MTHRSWFPPVVLASSSCQKFVLGGLKEKQCAPPYSAHSSGNFLHLQYQTRGHDIQYVPSLGPSGATCIKAVEETARRNELIDYGHQGRILPEHAHAYSSCMLVQSQIYNLSHLLARLNGILYCGSKREYIVEKNPMTPLKQRNYTTDLDPMSLFLCIKF